MVEKNVAYNRDGRSEEFADNDPLAELARLVSYEDRPSHVAPMATQASASPAERREPEFNLEDELLREFEIYDAPRSEPVDFVPANDASAYPAGGPGSFLQRVESVFGTRSEAEVQARHVPDVSVQHDAPVEPHYEPEPHYAPVAEQPDVVSYTLAPEASIRDDFSSDEVFYEPAARHEPVAPAIEVHQPEPQVHQTYYRQAVEEPAIEAPVAYEPVSHEPEPVVYEAAPVHEQPVAEEYHELPSWPGDERQGFAPEPVYEPEAPAQYYAEPVAAPVTDNFDLASEVEMAVAEPEPVAPVVAAPAIQRRSSLDYSSLRLPLANFGARRDPVVAPPAPAPVAPVVEAAHAPVEDYVAPVTQAPDVTSFASVPAAKTMSAMDELIYDVARYSIRNNDVEASTPVAHLQAVEEVSAEVAAPAPEPSRAEPSFASDDDFAGFADDEFELALEDMDFDLDLSDLDDIKVVEEPVSAQPAPAPVAPQPAAVAPVATPVVAAAVAAPVVVAAVSQPRPVAAPVAEAPRYQERASAAPAVAPVAPQPPASLESLPFDPSQIGETEDQPETIAEMEVPELPIGIFEPKPVRRHDDELDLDSELATFFNPTAAAGLDRHKPTGAQAPAQAPAAKADNIDEFERALEEDFRRSMQEASASRANAVQERTHVVPPQAVNYEDEGRSSKRWIMPVAAAVGVVMIAGGVYALMFGGSAGEGTNGAPVVIAADSEPMKIVPENPGGTTVPNQDKAVYDRVAGGAPADPKQSSLISSSEEPVDVVQRTLIPENLPLEGEGEDDVVLGSTPVGETEDPRLLSREETAGGNADNGTAPVNVSPRKVRTMIVRPDGTLVAQEVPAPAEPQQATNTAPASSVAAPSAQPAEPAPAVLAASRVPVAGQQPANTPAPTAPALAAPSQPQVATAPQAREAAPVPSSRPAAAQQPAPAATPAAPTQVAQAPAQAAAPATPAPAATSTPSAGGYYIQIASLPSEAEAQKSYQSLSGKFGSVIGGRGVDIKRADIEGRGTYYRVRIPAGDRSAANTMCERYRAAGGSCLVAR